MRSLTSPTGRHFLIIIIIIVLLCSALLFAPVDAALHTCGVNGQINLIGQNLGAATFDASASNCAVTLRGCAANSINFTAAVTNMVLVVENMAGEATQDDVAGDFLLFSSTVTGGSVNISGISRIIRGTAGAGGAYTVVKFAKAVASVRFISIKGIVVTANVSVAGSIEWFTVHFADAVGGDGAGSVFDFSNNQITRGSFVQSGDRWSAQLCLLRFGDLGNFETLAVTQNDLASITVNGGTWASARLVCSAGLRISLTGTKLARVLFRDNSLRAISVMVRGAATDARSALIMWDVGFKCETLTGVSDILVDGVDMREVSLVSLHDSTQLWVILLTSATLTMVHSSSIRIRNVFIGGNGFANTSGSVDRKILDLRTTSTTSVNIITISDSTVDCATGSASNSFVAFIDIHNNVSDLALTISNCSIRGKYSSGAASAAASLVYLFFIHALGAFNSSSFSIVNSSVNIPLQMDSGVVVFLGAVSDTHIIITNLGCLAGISKPTSVCVNFLSSFTGGSVNIDGISSTISGTTAGTYSIIRFGGDVSGVKSISIKGIVATANVHVVGGDLHLYPIDLYVDVTGDGSAGSAVTITGNTLAAGSIWTTTGTRSVVWLINALELSGFESGIEISNNSIAGITVSAVNETVVFLFCVVNAIRLSGTAASRIVCRNNSARGISISSQEGFAQLVLFYWPWGDVGGDGGAIAGVSEILIHSLDLRDVSVSSRDASVQLWPVLIPTDNLELVHNGRIQLQRVIVSGSVTCARVKEDGIRLLVVQSAPISGVREILISGCSIDMTGSGFSVTDGARALIVDIQLAMSGLDMISINNCSIAGKFSSASGMVEIYIFRAQSELGADQISILNNHVSFTTASAGLIALVAAFAGAVSAYSAGSRISISNNVLAGSAASGNAFALICIIQYDSSIEGFSELVFGGNRLQSVGSGFVSSGLFYSSAVSFVGPIISAGAATPSSSTATTIDINNNVMLIRASVSGADGGYVSIVEFAALRGVREVRIENNSMRGMTLAGSIESLSGAFFQADITAGNNSSSSDILTLVVSNLDIRDVSLALTHPHYGNLIGVYFGEQSSFSVRTAIAISGVCISGSFSYVGTINTGANLLYNVGPINSVESIIIVNSHIDLRFGTSVPGARVIARFAEFDAVIRNPVLVILVKNCTISGSYISERSSTGVALVHFTDPVRAATVSVINSSIRATCSALEQVNVSVIFFSPRDRTVVPRIIATDVVIDVAAAASTGAVRAFVLWFASEASGGGGSNSLLDVSRSVVRGDYRSSAGESNAAVQVAIALFASSLADVQQLIMADNYIGGVHTATGASANVEVRLVKFDALTNVGEIRIMNAVSAAVASSRSGSLRLEQIYTDKAITNCSIFISNIHCGTSEGGCILFDAAITGDVASPITTATTTTAAINIHGITSTQSKWPSSSLIRFSGAVKTVQLINISGVSVSTRSTRSSSGSKPMSPVPIVSNSAALSSYRAIDFASAITDVESIIVTKCTVGLHLRTTASSTILIVSVVQFRGEIGGNNLQRVVQVSDSTLRGEYKTQGMGANLELSVVRFDSAVRGVSQLLLNDNTLAVSNATSEQGSVRAWMALFASGDVFGKTTANGDTSSADVFDVSGTEISGHYDSKMWSVCVGAAAFKDPSLPSSSSSPPPLSGFEKQLTDDFRPLYTASERIPSKEVFDNSSVHVRCGSVAPPTTTKPPRATNPTTIQATRTHTREAERLWDAIAGEASAAAAEAVQTTAATMAVMASAAAPAAAIGVARALSLPAVATCTGRNGDGERWIEARLGFPMTLFPSNVVIGGTVEDGGRVRAAVISLLFVGLPLSALVGIAASFASDRTKKLLFGPLVVRAVMIVLGVELQGIGEAAGMLLSQSGNDENKGLNTGLAAAAIVVVLALLGLAAGLIFYATQTKSGIGATALFYVPSIVQPKQQSADGGDNPSSTQRKVIAFLNRNKVGRFLFLGANTWAHSDHGVLSLVRRYRGVEKKHGEQSRVSSGIEKLRGTVSLFNVVIVAALSFVSAVFVGVAKISRENCPTMLALIAAISVVMFLIEAAVRAPLVPLRQVVSIVSDFFTALIAVVAAAALGSEHAARSKPGIVRFVNIGTHIAVLLNVIATFGLIFVMQMLLVGFKLAIVPNPRLLATMKRQHIRQYPAAANAETPAAAVSGSGRREGEDGGGGDDDGAREIRGSVRRESQPQSHQRFTPRHRHLNDFEEELLEERELRARRRRSPRDHHDDDRRDHSHDDRWHQRRERLESPSRYPRAHGFSRYQNSNNNNSSTRRREHGNNNDYDDYQELLRSPQRQNENNVNNNGTRNPVSQRRTGAAAQARATPHDQQRHSSSSSQPAVHQPDREIDERRRRNNASSDNRNNQRHESGNEHGAEHQRRPNRR